MAKKKIPTTKETTPPKKDELRVDEQLMEAGEYEVTPEHTFTIDVYLKQKGSRWIVMEKGGRGVIHEHVVMRMWTYDEMVDLKKRATTYDQLKRFHMVDHDALNRMKLQKFLVSWTLDKKNPNMKLHHQNGVLTDECWTAFAKLQTNISTHIIDEMNSIYEYNG
jgi:hypothetical protein